MKKIKIDAWTIAGYDKKEKKYYIAPGSQCNFGAGHEYFACVFTEKKQALLAMKLHSNFYRGWGIKKIKIILC